MSTSAGLARDRVSDMHTRVQHEQRRRLGGWRDAVSLMPRVGGVATAPGAASAGALGGGGGPGELLVVSWAPPSMA